MDSEQEFIQRFRSYFEDANGSFQLPCNVRGGRTVAATCSEIMALSDPIVYDTLKSWDGENGSNGSLKDGERSVNVLTIARSLLASGQWEGAWAVSQLHYDQIQKREASTRQRQHKGHPTCGLAIVARDMGSISLARHYALLSSAGDIYWQHEDPALAHGGFGPTMLEQSMSSAAQSRYREMVRGLIQNLTEPIYLEALLANQWFGKSRGQHVLDIAKLDPCNTPTPFVDILLGGIENCDQAPSSTPQGTRFEAAAGLLLSTTPGFTVRAARGTSDEQVDLVVHYRPDPLSDLMLPDGPGLVECKSSKDPVSSKELRDFGAKCHFHRVKFGILVARANVSGGQRSVFESATNAELVRRRFLADGVTILVLDIDHLRGKARGLRGLQDALTDDHDLLVFGPIAGEA